MGQEGHKAAPAQGSVLSEPLPVRRQSAPARGAGAALALPWANTHAMAAHLCEISRRVAPGAHAVVLMDRAGWHTTSELTLPGNISLMFLPSRAPELNPVENIWQFLRQTYLSNRVFETHDEILDAACQAWNRLINQCPYQKLHPDIGMVKSTEFRHRCDPAAILDWSP